MEYNFCYEISDSYPTEQLIKFGFLIGFISKIIIEDTPNHYYGEEFWNCIKDNTQTFAGSKLKTPDKLNFETENYDSDNLNSIFKNIGADGNISRKAKRLLSLKTETSKKNKYILNLSEFLWENKSLLVNSEKFSFSCLIIEYVL